MQADIDSAAALEGTDPAQVHGARRTLAELLSDPHARGGEAGAKAPLPSSSG